MSTILVKVLVESIYVFLSVDCIKIGKQKLDKGEYLSFIEVEYENVFELLNQHIIKNGHSRIAIYETKEMVSDYLKKGNGRYLRR